MGKPWDHILLEAYCLYDSVSTADKIKVYTVEALEEMVETKKENEELEEKQTKTTEHWIDNPMKVKEKIKPKECPNKVCYQCFEIECPFLALAKGRWNDLDDKWVEGRKGYEKEVEGYKESGGTKPSKTNLQEQAQDSKDSLE